jgi:hypothetical protein
MHSTARSRTVGFRSGSRRTSAGVFVRLRSTACVCLLFCLFVCSLSLQHDALGRLLGHLRQRLAVGIGLFGEPARVPAHQRAHFHAQHSGSAADFCCGLCQLTMAWAQLRPASRLCGTPGAARNEADREVQGHRRAHCTRLVSRPTPPPFLPRLPLDLSRAYAAAPSRHCGTHRTRSWLRTSPPLRRSALLLLPRLCVHCRAAAIPLECPLRVPLSTRRLPL